MSPRIEAKNARQYDFVASEEAEELEDADENPGHDQIKEDYDYVEGLNDSESEELPSPIIDLLPSSASTNSSDSTTVHISMTSTSPAQAITSQTIQIMNKPMTNSSSQPIAGLPALPPFPTFPPGFPFQNLPSQTSALFNITFPNANFSPNITIHIPAMIFSPPVTRALVAPFPPHVPILHHPPPAIPSNVHLCYYYGTAMQYCEAIN